jgi:hypothetical protein
MTSEDYAEIRKIIQEEIEPVVRLVNRHDLCLYGEDGSNGIVSWVNSLKAHLRTHYIWTTIVVLPSAVGIILFIVNLLSKKVCVG